MTEGYPAQEYSADEMMTVSAARVLRDGMTCFVGIGLPSAAANLARATRAPGLVLDDVPVVRGQSVEVAVRDAEQRGS